MTVWILRQAMSAEEEAQIGQQTKITLPFEGLPDLTMATGPAQAIELLAALYPDDPPESINHRLDRFWKIFSELHFEDLIAVLLPLRQEVALAEVTGGYEYSVGANGEDIHRIPVTFYEKRIPMKSLRKHKELFAETNPKMMEVTDASARIALREALPHRYNRFAGPKKWLLALLFLMSLARLYQQYAVH